MGRIILMLLLISSVASAQPGYTKINARYNWLAARTDSGWHLPGYNGTPSGIRGGVWNGSGAVGIDTTNHRQYFYSGGSWRRLALYSEISSGGWGLTGNAGTTPGTDFIGTTDAQAFVIKTNNSERARVLSGGNVGIGTTTPDSTLHVVGGLKFVTGRQGAGKVLTSNASGGADWETPAAGSLGLQDVITNDPVLTTDNTIDGAGFSFIQNDFDQYTVSNAADVNLSIANGSRVNISSGNEGVLIRGLAFGDTSDISVVHNYILLKPDSGRLYIDTLNSGVGTKAMRYNPSTGLVTYADTTTGGGGGIGGSTGSTDNRILRADGTGGSTLQAAAPATLADDGTGTFNGVSIGTYGGSTGISKTGTDLYFITSAGALIYGAGSAGMRVEITDAGAKSTMALQYGGNYCYMKMGSNMQLYGSAGYTSLGAAGTLDLLKVSTTAITADLPVTLKAYTVGTLPTGVTGMVAYVTDALAPTYLTTVVGGGAIKAPVFFDGTNWVAH